MSSEMAIDKDEKLKKSRMLQGSVFLMHIINGHFHFRQSQAACE